MAVSQEVMGEERNAYSSLVAKSEDKRQLERTRVRYDEWWRDKVWECGEIHGIVYRVKQSARMGKEVLN